MQYQVEDLDVNSRNVDIIVKLIKRYDSRYAKGYKITNFLAADQTGAIIIPFWNDDCEAVKVGDMLQIQNGYVSVFRGNIQLNIGKYGSFNCIETPEDFEVNSEEIDVETKEEERGVIPIEELEVQSKNLTLHVYVKEIVEDRLVRTKYDGKDHRIVTFLVGDETGCVLLNLWDDLVDTLRTGTVIKIVGGYIKTFRGQRFLNVSKNGNIALHNEKVSINCTNNISLKISANT